MFIRCSKKDSFFYLTSVNKIIYNKIRQLDNDSKERMEKYDGFKLYFL